MVFGGLIVLLLCSFGVGLTAFGLVVCWYVDIVVVVCI